MEKLEPGALPTTILHHLQDGACLTIDALEAALGLSRRQISNGAAQLVLRGLLERVEKGCYQLTKSGQTEAKAGKVIKAGPWRPDTGRNIVRHRDTFRQRVWSAIRMSTTFTLGELVVAAARHDDLCPESNAARYVRQLKHAGYIAEMPSRQAGTRLTSNGFKRFRLVRNTGPAAPVFKPKVKTVHDFNTGEDWPCATNLS
jgi:hypothetical protein